MPRVKLHQKAKKKLSDGINSLRKKRKNRASLPEAGADDADAGAAAAASPSASGDDDVTASADSESGLSPELPYRGRSFGPEEFLDQACCRDPEKSDSTTSPSSPSPCFLSQGEEEGGGGGGGGGGGRGGPEGRMDGDQFINSLFHHIIDSADITTTDDDDEEEEEEEDGGGEMTDGERTLVGDDLDLDTSHDLDLPTPVNPSFPSDDVFWAPPVRGSEPSTSAGGGGGGGGGSGVGFRSYCGSVGHLLEGNHSALHWDSLSDDSEYSSDSTLLNLTLSSDDANNNDDDSKDKASAPRKMMQLRVQSRHRRKMPSVRRKRTPNFPESGPSSVNSGETRWSGEQPGRPSVTTKDKEDCRNSGLKGGGVSHTVSDSIPRQSDSMSEGSVCESGVSETVEGVGLSLANSSGSTPTLPGRSLSLMECEESSKDEDLNLSHTQSAPVSTPRSDSVFTSAPANTDTGVNLHTQNPASSRNNSYSFTESHHGAPRLALSRTLSEPANESGRVSSRDLRQETPIASTGTSLNANGSLLSAMELSSGAKPNLAFPVESSMDFMESSSSMAHHQPKSACGAVVSTESLLSRLPTPPSSHLVSTTGESSIPSDKPPPSRELPTLSGSSMSHSASVPDLVHVLPPMRSMRCSSADAEKLSEIHSLLDLTQLDVESPAPFTSRSSAPLSISMPDLSWKAGGDGGVATSPEVLGEGSSVEGSDGGSSCNTPVAEECLEVFFSSGAGSSSALCADDLKPPPTKRSAGLKRPQTNTQEGPKLPKADNSAPPKLAKSNRPTSLKLPTGQAPATSSAELTPITSKPPLFRRRPPSARRPRTPPPSPLPLSLPRLSPLQESFPSEVKRRCLSRQSSPDLRLTNIPEDLCLCHCDAVCESDVEVKHVEISADGRVSPESVSSPIKLLAVYRIKVSTASTVS